ncbi:hypothetical protein BCT01_00860 [Vibrio tasmaniensis]|uniref:Uncharacterized protein n=1 Tax=Vibrio tasmaniensis TaxID=212663 RepID=A0A2N7NCU4_9VIBR|nr:hypothetical protein BCT01_00860 [Vibrio tasmaniensis]PMP09965.1 hypothetical protein BCS92_02230 [Vibrio tasmaniensis]
MPIDTDSILRQMTIESLSTRCDSVTDTVALAKLKVSLEAIVNHGIKPIESAKEASETPSNVVLLSQSIQFKR